MSGFGDLVACPCAGPAPQPWLAHTAAPGVAADDRRRLDFVLYGATRLGEAFCCDVMLVSPVGHPHPQAAEHDGAVLEVTELLLTWTAPRGRQPVYTGPASQLCLRILGAVQYTIGAGKPPKLK